MSYSILPNSDQVGIGYITTSFSNAYPLPSAAFDILFSQAGRSIDIAAHLLGDLDSCNYLSEAGEETTNLASWLGETTTYSEIDYFAPRSGYPDSEPSGISDGLNQLQSNLGDMVFPTSSGYFPVGSNTITNAGFRSVTSEISYLDDLRMSYYGPVNGYTIVPGILTKAFCIYPPLATLNQQRYLTPAPEHGVLAGRPPMYNVIGIEDYGYASQVTATIVPYPTASVVADPSPPLPGLPPPPPDETLILPTELAPASGLHPLTIDERLVRLNNFENVMKRILVEKMTYHDAFSPVVLYGGNLTKTFTVPPGMPTNYIEFELWGAGGGGGGAISLYHSSYLNSATRTLAVSGTGGAPGAHLKFAVTGFTAGDRFVIHTGAGGACGTGVVGNWRYTAPDDGWRSGNGLGGGDTTIQYLHWNGSSYQDYGIIARAYGGYGGYGAGGRLEPIDGGPVGPSMPNVATPTYSIVGSLVLYGTPTIESTNANTNNGRYIKTVYESGWKNKIWAWSPLTYSDYYFNQESWWRVGGAAKNPYTYGGGGSGMNAQSAITDGGGNHAVTGGSGGGHGRISISWPSAIVNMTGWKQDW